MPLASHPKLSVLGDFSIDNPLDLFLIQELRSTNFMGFHIQTLNLILPLVLIIMVFCLSKGCYIREWVTHAHSPSVSLNLQEKILIFKLTWSREILF